MTLRRIEAVTQAMTSPLARLGIAALTRHTVRTELARGNLLRSRNVIITIFSTRHPPRVVNEIRDAEKSIVAQ